MNQKDNTKEYVTSKERIVKGINTVYDILTPTYGPNGGNIAMEVEYYPGHGVYNDGKRITDMIVLEDPIDQMGVNMLKEACDKQEKECGDGRKTTVILTTSILNEGLKSDKKPLEIKRELDKALIVALESLDKQKQEIDIKDIGKIAKIASESDEIANLIGEIYPQIGRDGIIEIESSNVPQTTYDIVDGIRLHGAKKLMDIEAYKTVSELKNVSVLIVKDKIMSKTQIEGIYKKIKSVKELVLYCDDIETSVLRSLALTNIAALNGEDLTRTLVVKSPVMWKDWIFEDLQKMTGATPIDAARGVTFNNFKPEYLGKVGTWKAEQDESRLNGTLDIKEHIEEIKGKQGMEIRANWLNTKVAILKVGANSESELSWKIKKTIDASNSSRLALKDGVVKGAGQAFKIKTESTILNKALGEPRRILEENEIPEGNTLDSAFVVKSALTTAVSLAGIILTLKGALVVPEYIKDMMRKMQPRQ